MNFKVDPLGLPHVHRGPQQSGSYPKCIFFTLKIFQITFACEIFMKHLQEFKLVFGRTETEKKTDGQADVKVEMVI